MCVVYAVPFVSLHYADKFWHRSIYHTTPMSAAPLHEYYWHNKYN